jgi:hypothetical protein
MMGRYDFVESGSRRGGPSLKPEEGGKVEASVDRAQRSGLKNQADQAHNGRADFASRKRARVDRSTSGPDDISQ